MDSTGAQMGGWLPNFITDSGLVARLKNLSLSLYNSYDVCSGRPSLLQVLLWAQHGILTFVFHLSEVAR